ncbi:hypothetical protein VP01_3258g1 [Puccinia sorghi]|uniref:Uncharacterized protein n=1 Tax=Puccinia sorghi TaxID=27349 RepID=A0A0L6UXW5_9BASI|nr:hypothetical protein VP01_3258g1 [Puccinia sorghi]
MYVCGLIDFQSSTPNRKTKLKLIVSLQEFHKLFNKKTMSSACNKGLCPVTSTLPEHSTCVRFSSSIRAKPPFIKEELNLKILTDSVFLRASYPSPFFLLQSEGLRDMIYNQLLGVGMNGEFCSIQIFKLDEMMMHKMIIFIDIIPLLLDGGKKTTKVQLLIIIFIIIRKRAKLKRTLSLFWKGLVSPLDKTGNRGTRATLWNMCVQNRLLSLFSGLSLMCAMHTTYKSGYAVCYSYKSTFSILNKKGLTRENKSDMVKELEGRHLSLEKGALFFPATSLPNTNMHLIIVSLIIVYDTPCRCREFSKIHGTSFIRKMYGEYMPGEVQKTVGSHLFSTCQPSSCVCLASDHSFIMIDELILMEPRQIQTKCILLLVNF